MSDKRPQESKKPTSEAAVKASTAAPRTNIPRGESEALVGSGAPKSKRRSKETGR